MTARMNSILSRVLSEELGRQAKWKIKDSDNGFDTTDRDEAIQDIKNFMSENNIEVRTDYYLEGKMN